MRGSSLAFVAGAAHTGRFVERRQQLNVAADTSNVEDVMTPTQRRKRQVFASGHRRKFLVVVDETPEVESALVFAANRVRRSGGSIALLYVIEPANFEQWLGVREVYVEEQQAKAQAVFRLFRRKLKTFGCEDTQVEDVVREGSKPEQILKLIEEDSDIAVLVLGASTDPKGPGPLVTSLATGKLAGNFPIPITIVPGTLTPEEIEGLA
jgi:nucleotide-binding universal stress UspA family protein